jgi:hypothetical protein
VSSVPEQGRYPQQGQPPEQAQFREGSLPDPGPFSFSDEGAAREKHPLAEPTGFPAPDVHHERIFGSVDLDEATRQLDLAAHDIAVAATCIGLGDLDEAHTNVITARAAADAAEEILRVALGSDLSGSL